MGDKDKLRDRADRSTPATGTRGRRATRRMAWEIEKRTSIEAMLDPVEVRLSDEAALKRNPFLYLAGDAALPTFDDADVARLRRALQTGGFLVIDGADRAAGRRLRSVGARAGGAAVSARAAAQDLARPRHLQVVLPVQDARRPRGRGALPRGRRATTGGWSSSTRRTTWAAPGRATTSGSGSTRCCPAATQQREMAFRLGINLAMYALCLDYKTDQVHVPFILRRRQWQSTERAPLTPMTYDEWRVVSLAPWGRLGQLAALACALRHRLVRLARAAPRRALVAALDPAGAAPRRGAGGARALLRAGGAAAERDPAAQPRGRARRRARSRCGSSEQAGRAVAGGARRGVAASSRRTRSRASAASTSSTCTPSAASWQPTTLESLTAPPPAHPTSATPRSCARRSRTCAPATKGATSAASLVVSDGVDNGRLGAALLGQGGSTSE